MRNCPNATWKEPCKNSGSAVAGKRWRSQRWWRSPGQSRGLATTWAAGGCRCCAASAHSGRSPWRCAGPHREPRASWRAGPVIGANTPTARLPCSTIPAACAAAPAGRPCAEAPGTWAAPLRADLPRSMPTSRTSFSANSATAITGGTGPLKVAMGPGPDGGQAAGAGVLKTAMWR